MNKPHYNCKAIRYDLNGVILDFVSRRKLLEYMFEEHGIGETTVRTIIKSGLPYKPRTNSIKYLTGLKIYYI